MSGGHAKQGPVGMPEPQGLHDSLAWKAPSSGQTPLTQVNKKITKQEQISVRLYRENVCIKN